MRFAYCPFCGTKTIKKEIGDEGLIPYCEKCERPLFDMFSTCVLTVAVNERGEAALIRQSYGNTERFVGIAGFMKLGETPEEAARREVAEETGLTVKSVQYIDSSFYNEREQLMLGMLACVEEGKFDISGELLEARWFNIDDAISTVREGSIIQKFLKTAKTYINSQDVKDK